MRNINIDIDIIKRYNMLFISKKNSVLNENYEKMKK